VVAGYGEVGEGGDFGSEWGRVMAHDVDDQTGLFFCFLQTAYRRFAYKLAFWRAIHLTCSWDHNNIFPSLPGMLSDA
jgi:hypothetical protein